MGLPRLLRLCPGQAGCGQALLSGLGAPCHGAVDPRAIREGESVRPLGHRAHLTAKAEGENSMLGKAGHGETAKACACRGPDGMVKPRLVEPKSPYGKWYRSDKAVEIRGLPERRASQLRGQSEPAGNGSRHAPGRWAASAAARRRNGHLQPSYTSTTHGTRDHLQGASPRVTEAP